ncbi:MULTISPECIES: hypothetical protein [unclassified Microbacterium]|uniref:hypothetical protein n=1 Tax=unclassified Microbacterium TaxID=2609290 RepID=UPI003659744F
MAYITNTITSANPGLDLHTAMASALTTAGYTLVDTVVISTRTHKVWKCPAANNTAGLDWYLDIAYPTTGNGNMSILPFESYDPATHLALRGIIASGSTTIDATTFSVNGATSAALESASNCLHAGNAVAGNQLVLTTSSFGYWISITGNRVIALTSADPTFVVYAGMHSPSGAHATAAGAKLFPLIFAKINAFSANSTSTNAPSSTACGLTRLPQLSSLTSTGWRYQLQAASAFPLAALPQIPSGATGAFPLATSPILAIAGIADLTQGAQGWWGTFYDLMLVNAAATVSRGDTITIGTDNCVLTNQSSNYALAFKAL